MNFTSRTGARRFVALVPVIVCAGAMMAVQADDDESSNAAAPIAVTAPVWSQQELVSGVPAFLESHPQLEKKLFLAIGTEHPLMHETLDKFAAALRSHAPPDLKWKSVALPDETHATVMHRATYQAYEFLYGDKYKGL